MNKIENLKTFTILMLIVGLLSSSISTAEESTQQNKIDHIIWAVNDLDKSIDFLKQKSGVKAERGATQHERGTRNALLSAGQSTYIEILAPAPEQMPLDPKKNPKTAFAYVINQLGMPEVDMFAYSTDDIAAAKKIGEELGFKIAGPYTGERTIASGEIISWTELEFYGHDFGQFIPFAMNWGQSSHPGKTSPKGIQLQEIVVEHPRHTELSKIYKALGVPATVKKGTVPIIRVLLSSEQGDFEIVSGKSLMQYYANKDESNY